MEMGFRGGTDGGNDCPHTSTRIAAIGSIRAAFHAGYSAAAAVTTEATELCKRDTVNAFFAQIGGVLRPAAA